MSKKSRKSKYCVSTQVFVSLLALVLVMGVAVGGTIAWLTAETAPVVNTFTVGDINITLTETWNTDTDGDEVNDAWSAQLIPGFTYKKDPVVTVKANSVDCYLFVKFEESEGLSDYLTYTSNLEGNGWTQGREFDIPSNVWYRIVNTSDADQSWEMLANNQVSVSDTLTKDDMPESGDLSLTYTAYACQLYKSNGTTFEVDEAWNTVCGAAE